MQRAEQLKSVRALFIWAIVIIGLWLPSMALANEEDITGDRQLLERLAVAMSQRHQGTQENDATNESLLANANDKGEFQALALAGEEMSCEIIVADYHLVEENGVFIVQQKEIGFNNADGQEYYLVSISLNGLDEGARADYSIEITTNNSAVQLSEYRLLTDDL